MSTSMYGPVEQPAATPVTADTPAGSSAIRSPDASDHSSREAAQIAARVERIPTGRFHLRVAGLVGAGTLFDGFDAISLAVVLPMVIATFHINFATAGQLISAGYAG